MPAYIVTMEILVSRDPFCQNLAEPATRVAFWHRFISATEDVHAVKCTSECRGDSYPKYMTERCTCCSLCLPTNALALQPSLMRSANICVLPPPLNGFLRPSAQTRRFGSVNGWASEASRPNLQVALKAVITAGTATVVSVVFRPVELRSDFDTR